MDDWRTTDADSRAAEICNAQLPRCLGQAASQTGPLHIGGIPQSTLENSAP
jgi:hypothetical protein